MIVALNQFLLFIEKGRLRLKRIKVQRTDILSMDKALDKQEFLRLVRTARQYGKEQIGSITYTEAGEYKYTVKETQGALGGITYDEHTAKVTVTIEDKDYDGFLEASIDYDNSAAETEADKLVKNAAAFTNTYDAGSTDVNTGEADVQLTKILEGKTWNGDRFKFTLKPYSNTADIDVADMPMPTDEDGDGEANTVTVSKPTDVDKNSATFSFGRITFDTPGKYVYKVTEDKGGNAGITYSDNEATITITVTDKNDGTYDASVTITESEFTNTYHSELDYADMDGFTIKKNLTGADITADQFIFTVDPANQDTAKKLDLDMGGQTFKVPAADMDANGVATSSVNIFNPADKHLFTQDDVGKTYSFTVSEKIPDPVPGGYTYDDTVYTVTITTEDNGQGGLTVTTKVKNEKDGTEQEFTYNNDPDNTAASVTFNNDYDATGSLGGNGSVKINATKELTNRPLGDGEFKFDVYNKAGASVATGTNDADGTITFGEISYSTQQMQEDVVKELALYDKDSNTYTYQYTVSEDRSKLPVGVTAVDDTFNIKVTVTDKKDGTLDIAVIYLDGGDSITFKNAYGDSAEAPLNINGTKSYVTGEGADNAPDIAGKYTFTLSGSEGAPMPDSTTVTNDAAGNVDFGEITFTMNNVFGENGSKAAGESAEDNTAAEAEVNEEAGIDIQSAVQEKVFTYTVTESGSVDGVDNDAEASKSFTVTVRDNGDGTISVISDSDGAKFVFTNTYNVDPTESSPTGDGGLTITKNLQGRDLAEGEFTAVMIDADGNEVASGTNDADGMISLGSIKFTGAGEYTYTIYERDDNAGGVTYDKARYTAKATVTDNGDGTLKIEWSFTDAEGNALENNAITFNNTYEAAPTSVSLGAAKRLEGRTLEAGEFTFELKDEDGNVVSKAKNDESGAITFDTISFDKVGTYKYTISETAGNDDTITYDDTVYNVTITVTDSGEGYLTASVDSGDKGLVFTNKYTKPAEPQKPDDSKPSDDGKPKAVQTGDMTSIIPAVFALIVSLAAIAAIAAFAIRRRRR